MTVDCPGEPAAGFGHQETKIFGLLAITLDQGAGVHWPSPRIADVFATAVREAADAVKEGKLRKLERSRPDKRATAVRGCKGRRQSTFGGPPRQLVFERSAFADDDHARDRVEQDALFLVQSDRNDE